VKGHSNLVGNEHADEIAKAVAKGHTAEGECRIYKEPSNDRCHKYWPHTVEVQKNKQGKASCADPLLQRKRRRPVDNLQDALKKQTLKRFRYGMANRDTTYFEAQKRVEDQTDIPMSNLFVTSAEVTFTERKVALRYRLGTMWTRKHYQKRGRLVLG
jgi:hypothetical protein